VKTELFIEDMEGAKQAFSKAERAYEVIERFVTRVQDTAQRQEIEQSLTLLRSRLDTLKGTDGLFHKG